MRAEDSLRLRQNHRQSLQASQAYLWQVTGWVRSLNKGTSVPGTVPGTGDHDSGPHRFHSLVDETETSTDNFNRTRHTRSEGLGHERPDEGHLTRLEGGKEVGTLCPPIITF